MLADVRRLRSEGIRLKPLELAKPLRGELRVGDAGATSFRRPTLVAQLWEPTHSAIDRPLGAPLFDAVLVHMQGSEFSIVGIELTLIDGRLYEYSQVWRCQLVST